MGGVLLINQTVGPLFKELAIELARRFGNNPITPT
jgi:hypothetical protein